MKRSTKPKKIKNPHSKRQGYFLSLQLERSTTNPITASCGVLNPIAAINFVDEELSRIKLEEAVELVEAAPLDYWKYNIDKILSRSKDEEGNPRIDAVTKTLSYEISNAGIYPYNILDIKIDRRTLTYLLGFTEENPSFDFYRLAIKSNKEILCIYGSRENSGLIKSAFDHVHEYKEGKIKSYNDFNRANQERQTASTIEGIQKFLAQIRTGEQGGFD